MVATEHCHIVAGVAFAVPIFTGRDRPANAELLQGCQLRVVQLPESTSVSAAKKPYPLAFCAFRRATSAAEMPSSASPYDNPS